MKVYGGWSIAFYAGFAILALTIFAPIFAVLIFLAPGLIGQMLLAVPHLAFDVASHQMPKLFNNLFVSEMQSLDSNFTSQITLGLRHNPVHTSLLGRMEQRAHRWWHFARTSALLSAVGFVPLLGPIVATLGQWMITSEELSFTLLEPWFTSMGWTMSRRTQFVNKHRDVLIGFSLPFVFLNAIPVFNVFALCAAEAATAHLVYERLLPELGKRRSLSNIPLDDELSQAVYGQHVPASAPPAEIESGSTVKGGEPNATAHFGEDMKAGTQRQAALGPRKMEADMSDDLRRVAGIPTSERLTPRAINRANVYTPL